ncbi:MAG: gp58-like family protein [candidate division KSB1 bacterium]|nr:gp58-like family protein [candidate division KSB1 bacterium]MDZ7300458.1 gp58-like family protein [candidate division KSB1 bacterium]MDZ7308636.1 gp58-like family protein [candidate division KSB1 bacterium]MDZ7351440.1 gp58-like family protein [candidate division KSB1 bacterium]MDZ7355799.1 gp58-like family protein [candidate division KSB1 bacterium]
MSNYTHSSSSSYESQEQRRRREERERRERERREAELRARLERERQERERQEREKREREAAAQRRMALSQQAVQIGLELQRAQVQSDVARLRAKLAQSTLSMVQRQRLEAEIKALQADESSSYAEVYESVRKIEAALGQPQHERPASQLEAQAQWLEAIRKFEADLLDQEALLERLAPGDLREIREAAQSLVSDNSGDYAYNLATLKGLQQRLREVTRACQAKAVAEAKRDAECTERLINLQARLDLLLASEPPASLRERAAQCQQRIMAALTVADPAARERTLQEQQPQVEKLERTAGEWQRHARERQQLMRLMQQHLEDMGYEVVVMPDQPGRFEAYIPGGEMVEISIGPDGSMISHVVHLVPEDPPTLPDQAEALAFEQQRDKWCSDYDRIAERLAQQGVQLTVDARELKSLHELRPEEIRQSARVQRRQSGAVAVRSPKYSRQ